MLCTAPGYDAQLAMLRELHRIVRPGGRIGLLVYLAVTPKLDDPPEGNHFPASTDRKSTRLNSSHIQKSRMPSSA